MSLSEDNQVNENPIQVRLMQAEDAQGVVALYREVYGDEYPIKIVYDSQVIIQQQEIGDMIRIVALDKSKVVGQLAIYRSTPTNPSLYEEGQGMVLPDYRNQGILEKCLDYGHMEVYPQMQIEQIWGEAVCNHVFTQKAGVRLSYIETGLELDLMPASSYVKEQSSQGRVSTMLVFKTYKALPQTLYLPTFYAEALSYLYSAHEFGHEFLLSQASLSDTPTKAHLEIYAGAGVARIALLEMGRDLEDALLEQEKEAMAQACCVLQVYLNLSNPSVGAAVNILREHQYFLGGILPRWFNQDGLMMQKILHEPNVQAIKLYTERAGKILELITEDRKSVLK